MLPQSYPNYKTVHRRFQAWCRDEFLRRLLTDVANQLRERGALDEKECFIDATFVMAKGGGAEIGATKRGKGMKIMAIVDRHGLPLSVSTHAANHHEVRLASSLMKNLKSSAFVLRFSSSYKRSVRFGSEWSRLVATLPYSEPTRS